MICVTEASGCTWTIGFRPGERLISPAAQALYCKEHKKRDKKMRGDLSRVLVIALFFL